MTIVGLKTDVLDQGFVRVVDCMGDDAAIVQAARISYGAGTKQTSEDEQLIRYLMRARHTSPTEQARIKLHVRVPMDAWRQWIRHRMSSTNEYSTRYSEAIDAMQQTSATEWRSQAKDNKQGSGEFLPFDVGAHLSAEEDAFQKHARAVYQRRLDAGVAREQARKDLPLSTYTEAYWTIDLHNLLHFLELRLHQHAQQEIRQYANAIAGFVEQWVPMTWRAFRDYRLNAISLSGPDIQVVRRLLAGEAQRIEDCSPELSKRERAELRAKLEQIGMLHAAD